MGPLGRIGVICCGSSQGSGWFYRALGAERALEVSQGSRSLLNVYRKSDPCLGAILKATCTTAVQKFEPEIYASCAEELYHHKGPLKVIRGQKVTDICVLKAA